MKPSSAGPLEIFELEIHGGAVERQFRARFPDTEQMPWGTLDVAEFAAEEVFAARRGWTDLALQEYSAAASFANTLRLLVRARVPIDLSGMLTRFPLDELVHTEVCARMAEELGGAIAIEYPTEQVFPSPLKGSDVPLVEAAKAIVRECCVGETHSLGMLKYHHRHATQPLLKAVWGRLIKDEAVHAQFGWIFMDWANTVLDAHERKQVAEAAELAIDEVHGLDEKVKQLPDEAFASIGIFGVCGRDAYLAQSQEIVEEKIVKRMRLLV